MDWASDSMTITNVKLKNFRCFREEQTARLAPLTLLVGENSTGKTSFLAMIRILYDVALNWRIPDFKEDPYDLGSFDEIAHHRGARGGRARSFEACLSIKVSGKKEPPTHFQFAFEKRGTAPVPTRRRLSRGKTWTDETLAAVKPYVVEAGTSRGKWRIPVREDMSDIIQRDLILSYYHAILEYNLTSVQGQASDCIPLDGAPAARLQRHRSAEGKSTFVSCGCITIRHMQVLQSAQSRAVPTIPLDPRRTRRVTTFRCTSPSCFQKTSRRGQVSRIYLNSSASFLVSSISSPSSGWPEEEASHFKYRLGRPGASQKAPGAT